MTPAPRGITAVPCRASRGELRIRPGRRGVKGEGEEARAIGKSIWPIWTTWEQMCNRLALVGESIV